MKAKLDQMLQQIEQQMQRLGDLPVFSASVHRVHRVSSEEESNAALLATEILKDANLVFTENAAKTKR